jgi:hypothetical protein
VRRRLTWLLVTLGIAALVRRLRRRSSGTDAPPHPPETSPADDHADELRRKLAASRVDEPEPSSAAPEGSVDERRADVHAEGRARLDDIRSTSDD